MQVVWIDYGFLAVILLSALFGLLRGFVREVMSVVIWILAFSVASGFSDPLAVALESMIAMPELRQLAAFLGIFIAVFIVGGLTARVLKKLVKQGGMGAYDKMLGILFGGLRGGMILIILVMIGNVSPLSQYEVWQQSLMTGYTNVLIQWSSENLQLLDGWQWPDMPSINMGGG